MIVIVDGWMSEAIEFKDCFDFFIPAHLWISLCFLANSSALHTFDGSITTQRYNVFRAKYHKTRTWMHCSCESHLNRTANFFKNNLRVIAIWNLSGSMVTKCLFIHHNMACEERWFSSLCYQGQGWVNQVYYSTTE